jgi:hypothetical protein
MFFKTVESVKPGSHFSVTGFEIASNKFNPKYCLDHASTILSLLTGRFHPFYAPRRPLRILDLPSTLFLDLGTRRG